MFAWNWASFIAFGVYAGWSAKSTTVILRKTGPSSVTSKRLVGGATGSHDFNTAQVVRVELITAALDSTPQQEQTPSRRSVLKLILNDNSEVVLGEKTRSSGVSVNGVGISNFLEAPLHKEAQTVADFLGVPLGAADMSNPITALQSAIHPSQAPATQYSVVPSTPESVAPSVPPSTPIGPLEPTVPSPVQPITPAAAPLQSDSSFQAPTNDQIQRF